jgi:hypothetical protein
VKSDSDWDLALVAISKPPVSIPTLSISQTAPKPGDPLWIAGFGSGAYRIAEGRCVRYLALDIPKDGTAPLNEIVEVSVSARKGDSGGPILNQKGELAGVLFGSDMIRNTAGSYCERVNRFLMDTQDDMAQLPSRPETHFAATEKNGPLHSLRDSRNAVPQTTATVPQRSDVSGASASPSGVRSSSSRRYVSPVNGLQRIQFQTPSKGQDLPATIKLPLTSLTPQTIEPVKVLQTAYLMPVEAVSVSREIPVVRPIAAERYFQKSAADRTDWLFTVCIMLNVFFAIGLACYAVRLLRV